MKTSYKGFVLLVLLFSLFPAQAKVILVNTTNNVSPSSGQTNLVQAIKLLEDGDTIRFALPGPGPFYLLTPPRAEANGYPAIIRHNVTIDGYSQPGALPNTNPILAANNAQLQVVLDSRAGGGHVESIPGFSTGESAVLFIKGATNVTVRGLGFLGPGTGSGTSSDPATYAIAFALGADGGHVSGCWIGVDLDRTNVYRFQDAITGFEGPGGRYIDGTVIGVDKSAADAPAARAQFNVIVGEYVPVALEGRNYRIAGNFFNVFPDGITDYFCDGTPPHNLQAFLEIGRGADNLVLGTDGDGVNDAEERNLFGGVTAADDGQLLEWYGGDRTNMVIAGNYFGVGCDGTTRFTNSMKVFGGFTSATTVRVGSDFDGVSDDLEGNLIAMNYPFDQLFPLPAVMLPPRFADLAAGARVSLRGNRLIGNNLPLFSWADGTGNQLQPFLDFYAPYCYGEIIPVLSTNSNQGCLRGICAVGMEPYTTTIIDVYLADPEGWTNGQQFQFAELMCFDPASAQTSYLGFAQGRTWLGSFQDNGPWDLDPASGQFEFNIAAWKLPADALVTLAASYSADPPGTHNARTHTGPFATPVNLQPAPTLSISKAGNAVLLSWPTNAGVFRIQSTSELSPAVWTDLAPQPPVVPLGSNYQATLPLIGTGNYLRLAR